MKGRAARSPTVPEAALAARYFQQYCHKRFPDLLLAFNNCCDVIVATAVTGDEPVAQEQAVLEFVNCDLAAHGSSDIRALVQPPPVNGPGVGAEHKEPKPSTTPVPCLDCLALRQATRQY